MVLKVNIPALFYKVCFWLSFYIKVYFDKLKHWIGFKKEVPRVCKVIKVLKIDNKVDRTNLYEYETWTQKIDNNYMNIINQGKHVTAFYINIYTIRDLEVFSYVTNKVNVNRVHIEIKDSLIHININNIFRILANNHCFEVEGVTITIRNYSYLFRYCKYFSDKNLKKFKFLIYNLKNLRYVQIYCDCICCSHSHNMEYTVEKNTTRNRMIINGDEIII